MKVIVFLAIFISTLIFPQISKAALPNDSPITKKVLVLIYNPILESKGGVKLSSYYGWNNPNTLSDTLVQNFRTASGSVLNYDIVERVELDDYPTKIDGFKYTDDSYLNCFDLRGSYCHDPDSANYVTMLNTVDACGKANRGEIDEVWIWGAPWFGYWESNLTGPGSFWYNSGPTTGTTCEKMLPIMGFNYERGIAEALESYAHRVESTMRLVYQSWEPRYTHNWNKFTLLDVDLPGKGGCGNAHNGVNATTGTEYDSTNTRYVQSDCDDFLDYPNIVGNFRSINCSTWGCSGESFLKWWHSHIPHFSGLGPDNRLNNWWTYIVNPKIALEDSQKVLLSYTNPSSTPSSTLAPSPTATPSPNPTSTSVPSGIGDANGDGRVDETDYDIWLQNFGQDLTGAQYGDFSLDGKVDGIDYVIWTNTYGSTPPTPTPESRIINETFDGEGALDITKWGWSGSVESSAERVNDMLKMDVDQGTDSVGGRDVVAFPRIDSLIRSVVGDFEVSVDLLGVTSDSGWQELKFAPAGSISVRRVKQGLAETLEVWTSSNNTPGTSVRNVYRNLPVVNNPIKVKLARVGEELLVSYYDGRTYINIFNVRYAPLLGSGMIPTLVTENADPNYPATTAYFDNYYANVNLLPLTTPTPIPTSTPTPVPTPRPTRTPKPI